MQTQRSLRLVAVAAVWAAAHPAIATERHVPGDYGTIQAAIDACLAGDTVIVADGTFTGTGNNDLDFGGKAITVRSASGNPATCIIDCEGSGRGFYFHSGETATSVVQGFTVRNGLVTSSSTGGAYGGGVYCSSSSSPTLTNCAITGNTADSGNGGGGGVYCSSGCSPTLAKCTITSNTAYHSGGVYCNYASPRLTNCTIAGNTAQYYGGVYCRGSPARPALTNCTIAGNTAQYGGGVYCELTSSPALTNCILWANAPQQIAVASGSPVVTYSDIQGGWSGTANINAEPHFAFPTDLHLLPNSPCIDAGTNSPSGGLPPDDLDGQPRPLDGDGNSTAVADMGAYEFSPSTPGLAVNAAELVFIPRSGQIGSQTLKIRNSSLGTLAWELEWEAAWLAAEPTAGGSAGEVDTVTLTADAAGLTPGRYATTLWVNAPQAPNAPRSVTIVLHVGSTLSVPAQYATIQGAIDAATLPGDEVVVADGVYTGAGNKDLDFHGRAITVRSASGDPNTCTIDCEGNGRGFYFHTSETAAAVVQGLAVRNGSSTSGSPGGAYGGGVYCSSASPTLTNCTITASTAQYGGGVYCDSSSSPTLTDCVINHNNADSSGGGVYCPSSSPTLSDCRITDNTAQYGGGVNCDSSSSTLTRCMIRGNAAQYGGGVWSASSSKSTLTNCMIRDNTATYGGGGVYCNASSPNLTNCNFMGNTVTGSSAVGGGVLCDSYSSPALINCTLVGNSATGSSGKGGGVFCYSSSPGLINCTLLGNSATGSSGSGGGVYCEESASPTLTNCILWANRPEQILSSSSSPVVTYCDVQGGWSGAGNIDAEPQFALPTDFHLLPYSPCIDAGTNSVPGGLLPDDGDGQPRPLDGDGNGSATADMGTYEFNRAAPSLAMNATELVIVARLGQTDSQMLKVRNSGLGTLAWALQAEAAWLTAEPAAGESAGEVEAVTLTADAAGLALGTYATTLWANAPQAANAPRALAVVLHVRSSLLVPAQYATIQAAIDAATLPGDEVVVADGVYTGAGNKDLDFHGRAITVRSASRDPNTCIIDCGRSGRGFYFHSGESAAAIVQGLTIRNGSVGGVYCGSLASPTLTNCVIKDNNVDGSGGGVLCNTSSNPTLTNCTIMGNRAGYDGGGVLCLSSCPRLINCMITGNTAQSGGGVGCANSADPTLTNCIIAGNAATSGGGVYTEFSCTPRLTNCTITDNSAAGGGDSGGGVYCQDAFGPRMTNCILWANTPQQVSVICASPVLSYCDVQGGWTGTGNISADPLFLDPNGPDNDPNTFADNDYRLSAGSPCIDAGNNGAVPADTLDLDGDGNMAEPLSFDLAGRPRFVDDSGTPDCRWAPGTCGTAPIIDMGAHEFQGTTHLAGDLSCDGILNCGDINPFVLALGGQAAYEAKYPNCRWLNADINADGVVNYADINTFVRLLAGN